MDTCELCNLEKKTKWFYDDAFLIVCNCLSCKIPMVVWREHKMDLTHHDLQHMKLICDNLFGKDKYEVRAEQRKIRDHFHIHIILK